MTDQTNPDPRPDWPHDIDRESGSRVPLPRREEFDAYGQEVFDATLESASAPYRKGIPGGGLTGPAGIQLRSPHYRRQFMAMNDFLRFKSGIEPRMREVAILCAARETDHQYEWCGHEPMAIKVGIEPELIETIYRRGPLDGVAHADAAIIRLVREAVGDGKVSSQTYADAHELVGTEMLVNLCGLIGHYLSVGVLLRVFDRQLKDGWNVRDMAREN